MQKYLKESKRNKSFPELLVVTPRAIKLTTENLTQIRLSLSKLLN
jgi:hypothetical protein